MKRFSQTIAAVLPICLSVAGCMTDPNVTAKSSSADLGSSYQEMDVSTLTYRAVDRILADAQGVVRDTPLVVSSLADTQHLEQSSALGNIIADMIRTRLVQTGHKTSEFRLRSAMNLRKDEGEFALSRNRGALQAPREAAAVMTGTYAISFQKVYVSIKLISSADSSILGGADFVVPLADVLGMMDPHST